MKEDAASPARQGITDYRQAEVLRRGTLRGPARAVARWLLLQVIRPFIKLRIEGLDLVPRSGSFLFIANHLHNADPVLLEMALTRPVHMMAKQELFRNRVLGWLVRRTGAFPVDRGRPDRAAIRHAEALLANGIPVGMFPEGTRSTSGVLQTAYPGAGLIALRSGAIILPAAIFGTEELPFNGSRSRRSATRRRPFWRRSRVTIRFGAPFPAPTRLDDARVTTAQATESMMAAIAELLPGAYRGAYATNGNDRAAGADRSSEQVS